MMNTKRLLSLLLLGSFIFNNSMVATWSREMYETFGVTKPQFAKASKEKQEAWITQLSASKSRSGGENLGGNQGDNQGGNQGGTRGPVNVPNPDPVDDPAPDFGPDFTNRIARVDSEEAAVALALEILEYLAKPGVLNFNNQQIDSSTKWDSFIGSVNERKAELHGRQWKLKDASCVLVQN